MQNIHIVKIGSDSINDQNIHRLCNDITTIQKNTQEKVILVSSGSVKHGKQLFPNTQYSKPFYAGLGQKKLIEHYEKYYSGNLVGLLNDDFSQQRDEHLAKLILEYLSADILPIINYNDAMSDSELDHMSDKTDNDKNALHIAQQLQLYSSQIKSIIYLTNTNGVLNFENNTIRGNDITPDHIYDTQTQLLQFVKNSKSTNGTGGMGSKITSIFKAMSGGIQTGIIANASDGLDCLLDKKSQYTQFNLIK